MSANGDISGYEKSLGFDIGYFDGGGVSEAITDLIPNSPSNISVTETK